MLSWVTARRDTNICSSHTILEWNILRSIRATKRRPYFWRFCQIDEIWYLANFTRFEHIWSFDGHFWNLYKGAIFNYNVIFCSMGDICKPSGTKMSFSDLFKPNFGELLAIFLCGYFGHNQFYSQAKMKWYTTLVISKYENFLRVFLKSLDQTGFRNDLKNQ